MSMPIQRRPSFCAARWSSRIRRTDQERHRRALLDALMMRSSRLRLLGWVSQSFLRLRVDAGRCLSTHLGIVSSFGLEAIHLQASGIAGLYPSRRDAFLHCPTPRRASRMPGIAQCRPWRYINTLPGSPGRPSAFPPVRLMVKPAPVVGQRVCKLRRSYLRDSGVIHWVPNEASLA